MNNKDNRDVLIAEKLGYKQSAVCGMITKYLNEKRYEFENRKEDIEEPIKAIKIGNIANNLMTDWKSKSEKPIIKVSKKREMEDKIKKIYNDFCNK